MLRNDCDKVFHLNHKSQGEAATLQERQLVRDATIIKMVWQSVQDNVGFSPTLLVPHGAYLRVSQH